jgi:hypothetical protein
MLAEKESIVAKRKNARRTRARARSNDVERTPRADDDVTRAAAPAAAVLEFHEACMTERKRDRPSKPTSSKRYRDDQVVAEEMRVTGEDLRQTAEENRERAEALRASREIVRETSEHLRAIEEQQRKLNEETRAAAEQLRMAAEELRAAAELSRATAEIARTAAESVRETQEGLKILLRDLLSEVRKSK